MNIIENKNKEIKELTRIIENLIYKEFNKMNEIYDNNDKDFNKLNQMLNNNDKELKKLKKMIFIDNSSNNDKLHQSYYFYFDYNHNYYKRENKTDTIFVDKSLFQSQEDKKKFIDNCFIKNKIIV